jgi:hypothetical protein
MDIRNFLRKNKIICRDYAYLVDMNQTTLNSYIYRKYTPTVLGALKILHASNYEIDMKTLLSREDEDIFLRWKRGFKVNKKIKLNKSDEQDEFDDSIESSIEESEDVSYNNMRDKILSEIKNSIEEDMKKFEQGFSYKAPA